ncbi:DNA polymerase III subunit beta [Candidatus Methylocalor cossyra]|uniref:Beta sliding clamp n=1 Tax=Candidatus Methylocalor cossyra TaxID=3108543 RepID=A0ABM9NDX3_9GAMM
MKFTLPRESLLAPLQQVGGVIERRQTLPILSHVLLRLEGDQLRMTGTDLEVQLTAMLTVERGEDGEITIPARKLLDICRLLPQGSAVEVDIREDRCRVRSGSSRFTLATLPADQFPEFDTGAFDLELQVPAEGLRRALGQTAFAMAQNDVRYYLNGLLLELEGKTLRAVASDGHRLALHEEVLEHEARALRPADPPDPPSEPRQAILPRKAVLELLRLLGDVEGNVELRLGPVSASLAVGPVTFATKLVQGKFPDYRRVMPKELDREVRVDRVQLQSALERVAVVTSEKFKGISLEVSDETLRLKAQNQEQEEAEETLPVELRGEALTVGFNATYLLDAVEHVTSERVRFSFPKAVNACLVEDEADDRFRFIVMPMRL